MERFIKKNTFKKYDLHKGHTADTTDLNLLGKNWLKNKTEIEFLKCALKKQPYLLTCSKERKENSIAVHRSRNCTYEHFSWQPIKLYPYEYWCVWINTILTLLIFIFQCYKCHEQLLHCTSCLKARSSD